jgi:Transposase domain (DUF772)
MRSDVRRDGLPSYVRPESRIPSNHPLRLIHGVADEALEALDAQFAVLYSENGRPSIPPEQLLRVLLVQAFYSIRSERQLQVQAIRRASRGRCVIDSRTTIPNQRSSRSNRLTTPVG